MAIQSGQSMTASDLNSLKTALLTLYANRTLAVEGRTLSSTSNAPYTTVNGGTATYGNLAAIA